MKKRHGKNKKSVSNEVKHSKVLSKMIDVYEPDGEDWMGFKLSSDNQYTFHHIRERRCGGREEVENGAILTNRAHQFLNHLDCYHKDAYNAYQEIFKRINKSNGPIDDDLREDIYFMMLDVFYYNIYHIAQDELQFYDEFTKVKVKK